MWSLWKGYNWYIYDGFIVGGNGAHIYTLYFRTGGTSWKPVVIVSRTIDCDPKYMLSTRAELSGILT